MFSSSPRSYRLTPLCNLGCWKKILLFWLIYWSGALKALLPTVDILYSIFILKACKCIWLTFYCICTQLCSLYALQRMFLAVLYYFDGKLLYSCKFEIKDAGILPCIHVCIHTVALWGYFCPPWFNPFEIFSHYEVFFPTFGPQIWHSLVVSQATPLSFKHTFRQQTITYELCRGSSDGVLLFLWINSQFSPHQSCFEKMMGAQGKLVGTSMVSVCVCLVLLFRARHHGT